jgi:hypothetical protein
VIEPKGKIHGWAIGIVGGFVVFVGAIMTLVIMSMSKEVDLVTDHYYDKELRYQERIHALDRASDSSAAIVIEERRDTLLLHFPPTVDGRRLAGTVTLYRASNSKQDRAFALRPDASHQQTIATAGLMPGLWRVKLEWRVEGVEYYSERVVMLN